MQAVNLQVPERIALVDFQHMLTVNFKARANDSGPNDAGQATLNQLAEVRRSVDHVVVCMDSPPYWRKQVFPEYKKGREREPEFDQICKWTRERLAVDGYNVARAQGEEADDVIATLARIYSEEYGCPDVRIIGADKDSLQCVTESVRMFVPKPGGDFEIRGPEYVRKAYEVEPKDFSLLLAINGDTSDHIPGIKGIGWKGGAKLIATYKTPDGFAKACTEQIDACKAANKPVPAFWRNYAAGMAELPKWQKLTTLNAAVSLDQHPLRYLEHIEPQPLVQDEISDADDSAFYDRGEEDEVPWEQIAEDTAARERAELAAALPVGPGPAMDAALNGHKQASELPAPRIGADPNADEILRNAAASREAEKERIAEHALSAFGGAKDAAIEAAEKVIAGDPKGAPAADAPTLSVAPAAHRQPHEAEVVPPTRGPRKLQDEIPQTAALARVDAPRWELAVQPATAHEMLAVAKTLINSRYYSNYGTPQGVFAVMALGRELGFGFAAALEAFHIVQGRPFPKAKTLKALAEKDPNCEWIMVTHADDKSATIKTKHRQAGLLEYTYTRERAEQAGYFTGKNRDNWITKTQEMLEARATSKGVNRWYPGSTFGLASAEEAEDFS